MSNQIQITNCQKILGFDIPLNFEF
jgi:hypothetical protein